MESELRQQVAKLGPTEHERQERSVDKAPAAEEHHADDTRERQREGGATENRDHAEEVEDGRSLMFRKPTREGNVPPRQRIVRQIILGNPCENDGCTGRGKKRKAQLTLPRCTPDQGRPRR